MPLEGVKILVVDDDARSSFALTTLLEQNRAEVTVVDSGQEALDALKRLDDVDIVLMDIVMPGMDGYATIRAIRALEQFASLPVVAVTGKVMAGERKRCLDAGADDYVPTPVNAADLVAGLTPLLRPKARHLDDLARSPDRVTDVRAGYQLTDAFDGNSLEGVTILVVDDDFRNIFAMTALLERGQATVAVAESGVEAIAVLERTPAVDIVLMDIMMPIMDGYDTIRAIRARSRFEDLPIVAVTGKSAAGERQRCLDAGANDYIPKPVDVPELLAALAPWLPRVTSAAASS
jgi:hypothetical protein